MRNYSNYDNAGSNRNAFRRMREEKKEKEQNNRLEGRSLQGNMTNYVKAKNDYILEGEWLE